jgi:diguanylate cyclase (GGDEF)-like protein
MISDGMSALNRDVAGLSSYRAYRSVRLNRLAIGADAPVMGNQRLAAFLAAVSGSRDEASATRDGAARAAEALAAEVAAILQGGLTAIAAAGGQGQAELPGLGPCQTLVTPLDHLEEGRLVLARRRDAFSAEEADLALGMGRMLGLTVRMLRGLDAAERRALEVAHLNAQMEERQRLLERLSRIQRSISTRVPLGQVLDAIVRGAKELLGEEIAALRLLDSDDPGSVVLAAATGVEAEVFRKLRRTPVTEGVSGRAIIEDRLVVVHDYERAPDALPEFAARRLKAAMAAPVRENGVVVGSLAVASYDPERVYSPIEQEVLLAFAEHASLALTDARTVDAVHQAFHDPLTGLPNRAMFAERLDERLRRGRGEPLAILFLDLDRFKLVNDSLGHDAGDELLVAVAGRLGTCLDEGLVARFGGDEFAILLGPGPQIEREALAVAGRVEEALAEPVRLSAAEVPVRASVGIAISQPGEEHAGELLRNADIAMYRAKADETRRCTVFEPAMRASGRSTRASCASSSSRPSTSGPATSAALRRWSAGSTPSVASSPRPSSSP